MRREGLTEDSLGPVLSQAYKRAGDFMSSLPVLFEELEDVFLDYRHSLFNFLAADHPTIASAEEAEDTPWSTLLLMKADIIKKGLHLGKVQQGSV